MCPKTVQKVEEEAAQQDVRKAHVVYKYIMIVNGNFFYWYSRHHM